MGEQPSLGVGSKVLFDRGMFGEWPGTIRRIYRGRGRGLTGRGFGKTYAVVRYTRKNGSFGTIRVRLDSLRARPLDTGSDTGVQGSP